MTYGQILKRAWDIAWNRKILWLFGFLVGGGYTVQTNERFDAAQKVWVDRLLRTGWDRLPALAIGIAVVSVVFVIALMVISVAANGGLVRLADDADAGAEVDAAEGFRTGFRRWWSVFGLGLIAVLVLLGAAALLILIASVAEPLLCVAAPLAGIGLIFAAVVGVPVWALALRFVVLDGNDVTSALSVAWQTVRLRRNGPILFGLLIFVIQIAGSVAMGAVGFPVAFFVDLLAKEGSWIAAYGTLGTVELLLLVPAILLTTFTSVAWTLYFRHGDLPVVAQEEWSTPTYPPPGSPRSPYGAAQPADWPPPQMPPMPPPPPAPPAPAPPLAPPIAPEEDLS